MCTFSANFAFDKNCSIRYDARFHDNPACGFDLHAQDESRGAWFPAPAGYSFRTMMYHDSIKYLFWGDCLAGLATCFAADQAPPWAIISC